MFPERKTDLKVDKFKHSMSEEIEARLAVSNRALFALQHVFKCKKMSRTKKIIIYKTILRPEVIYFLEA